MKTTSVERVAQYINETPKVKEIAERCIRQTFNRTAAARQFVETMTKCLDLQRTPNGDRFTQHAFKVAMKFSAAQAASDLVNTPA